MVLICEFCPNTDEKMEPLSWDCRVHIALDVARGVEYLHDGVSFYFLGLPFPSIFWC